MLKVHARKLGSVSVLALEGRIVNGEAATLREAVQSQITGANSQPRAGSLVLDLARVSAIDASGLGLLLELRNEAHSRGIRFRVMNASRLVRRIFEITRLDSVFEAVTGPLPATAPARSHAAMRLAPCA